jgi:hypothetical protein
MTKYFDAQGREISHVLYVRLTNLWLHGAGARPFRRTVRK